MTEYELYQFNLVQVVFWMKMYRDSNSDMKKKMAGVNARAYLQDAAEALQVNSDWGNGSYIRVLRVYGRIMQMN